MSSWLDAAPPDEIDAGPMRLRRWRRDEAERLARLVTENLDHLAPWMPWAQQVPTVEEERDFLDRIGQAWSGRTDFGYAVALAGDVPAGAMGLHTRQGPGTLEIGYWIAAAHTGRGLATAGARALTDVAFALPGVGRVEIRCDEANHASAAVPRKLGFTLTEIASRPRSAPSETGRFMVWAVGRADWPVRSG